MRYRRPESLEEALPVLQDEDAHALAGGVSLVLMMNAGLLAPELLVDLSGVPELAGIRRSEGVLDIGALTTHRTLATHDLVRRYFPAASGMFDSIGNIRVRSAGTVGGNLVHADPAQDPAVLLSVLGARATITGPGGSRSVPVEELADGPLMSCLDVGEILTRVHVPLPAPNEAASYEKYLAGTEDDYATVSVACDLIVGAEGVVERARIAAGAVGPTVMVLHDAAQILEGAAVDDEDVLRSLEESVRGSVRPSADRRGGADYKRAMAAVMARRAVVSAWAQATSFASGPGSGRQEEP